VSYVRTSEHRALRAELIRRWKPWEKSTGPKTAEGKARAAVRGYKGGTRTLLRALSKTLREQAEWHAALVASPEGETLCGPSQRKQMTKGQPT
jgi:hypothetical protein